MILSAIAAKLKQRAKADVKGRRYEAALIVQAVSWYLRYPLSYRDIEELFLERGVEVDHSTLNRWVLAYAPLIERRLRAFRKPHCGSIRIDCHSAFSFGAEIIYKLLTSFDIGVRGLWPIYTIRDLSMQ